MLWTLDGHMLKGIQEKMQRKDPPRARQVLVDLLAEQVTIIDFGAAFQVFYQAMTVPDKRKVFSQ